MELKEQTEFYNKYWKDYKNFGSYKLQRLSEIVKILEQVRKIKRNPKILDLGCGDGRFCAVWNEVGETVGMDLSTKAMDMASKRYPFIDFHAGDATKTEFKDGAFDIIISQEVIEHIEIQHEYVKECQRLLSHNGVLILTTPNKYYFDRRKGGNYSNQPIENILNPSQLKDLLAKDFRLLDFYTIIHPKGDYGIYKLLGSLIIRYGFSALKAEFLLQRIMSKSLLGLNIVCIAQKKNRP
jgi:SAM-dependent methyltransferase